jgi:hypothetical protein
VFFFESRKEMISILFGKTFDMRGNMGFELIAGQDSGLI